MDFRGFLTHFEACCQILRVHCDNGGTKECMIVVDANEQKTLRFRFTDFENCWISEMGEVDIKKQVRLRL